MHGELSASLLLCTGSTITVAVANVNRYDTGQFEPVCAPAVLTTAVEREVRDASYQ